VPGCDKGFLGMDIEQPERQKLMDTFGPWFEFEEHVKVWSPFWGKTFEIDVLGKPKDTFKDLIFAFEVKNKKYWKPSTYGDTFRQAADYRYCFVMEGKWKGEIINSAYVFKPADGAQGREGELKQLLAIERLAAKFRVGVATTEKLGKPNEVYMLKFSNEFWRSTTGYTIHAEGNLKGKRPVGGTKITWVQICERLNHLKSHRCCQSRLRRVRFRLAFPPVQIRAALSAL
jgi:hypothetical protein